MSPDELAPPKSGDDLSVTLFERYCAGDSSAQDRVEIDVWMARHPEQQVWYEEVRDGLVAGSFAGVSESDLQRHVDTILRRVSEVSRRPATVGRRVAGTRLFMSDRMSWSMWSTLAALVIVVVAWLGMTVTGHQASRQTAPVLTYTTGNGQRANITLPDGNTAALNVASRLDVPADYLAGNHTVRLSGEAFFMVTHHDGYGAPFTVTTGTTIARVLGTSFLVRHYRTDPTTVVAVREGKVSVGVVGVQSGRALVLAAARQVEIFGMGSARVGPVNAAQFSFASGLLTLSGGLLSEAIPELDRWYDADIRLGDPVLGTRRLTGEYAAGSLGELATILELTFDVRVVRDGRVLTLYPR